MFCGMLSLGSLHGAGYFVLQALRVCTVITLLAAAAGCWVLIIQVDKYKSFFQGYDTDAFSPHFSKLVLSAGILCVIFGVLNIISALVWRDAKQGITSRDIRTHGSLAADCTTLPSYSASPASSVRNEKTKSKFMSKIFHRGAGNDDIQHAGRPIISGPLTSGQNPTGTTSPIIPGLKRPDTALHPMHGHRASSQYSVADHLPRH
ncbi:hypothetical protein LLEC1_03954 [Akanthomyces lecanii]|uniref:DUF7598 domain-containing protein n=1 Tax=Cordyceps confragosa TaxID=2714763 RepID=A0A179I8V0_CORDF|nr:hypothetical protein LLEC1_03954 [Akanthomyces lecanii]